MKSIPLVSVVVPTYNRKGYLRECLNALTDQSYPAGDYEVIVVDDGSTDGTGSFLKDYSTGKNFLRFFSQPNLGPSAARNLGIEKSKGEIICFVDDDCIADKNWIGSLAETYADPQVGGAGGKIIAKDVDSLCSKYVEASRFFDNENNAEVFIAGLNSSYRRQALCAIGGFDPFFRFSEDVDIGTRIRISGYKLRYVPDAIVFHNHRAGFQAVIRQIYCYGRGYASLHKKYPKNFYPGKRILRLFLQLGRKIAIIPFRCLKVFFSKERRFYTLCTFFDVCLPASEIFGVTIETFFGRPYEGEKINKSLYHILEARLPDGWGT
jgi:glycosyltransferase involved in cell wall biosynthesis